MTRDCLVDSGSDIGVKSKHCWRKPTWWMDGATWQKTAICGGMRYRTTKGWWSRTKGRAAHAEEKLRPRSASFRTSRLVNGGTVVEKSTGWKKNYCIFQLIKLTCIRECLWAIPVFRCFSIGGTFCWCCGIRENFQLWFSQSNWVATKELKGLNNYAYRTYLPWNVLIFELQKS